MYPIIAKYAGAESILASETNYKIDLKSIKLDFLSSAGHKFHGPKGVGFTYINKSTKSITRGNTGKMVLVRVSFRFIIIFISLSSYIYF